MILKFLLTLGFGKEQDDASLIPAQAVNYKGYMIVPTPRKVEAGWTTEGEISKEIKGVPKSQYFIRADTLSERDEAVSYAVRKAKRIIDEQGDALFTGQATTRR